jgi:hypothetical protein
MYIFIPKIPIWLYFEGPRNGKDCYVVWPFGIFYGNLVYSIAIWYILWSFGMLYQEKSGNPAQQKEHAYCINE